MILGIGIDMVDTKRFETWHTKPVHQLMRIFSEHEITYCLEHQNQSAQRFAVRFAAKEAFYKAYCAWQQDAILPLITVCNIVSVAKNMHNVPHLLVNWHMLKTPYEPICHVTLSHTQQLALAQVLLEAP
jgi:phosphopantetheine--protein transferase-like protein